VSPRAEANPLDRERTLGDLNRVIKPKRRRAEGLPLPGDTRTRILDAAEQLFAARGIEAVSVRAILEEAGVNVALAHYHFGSREGLIAELLQDRVGRLMAEVLRSLEEVDGRGRGASLEDVLRAYFVPQARWTLERPRTGRLLAQIQMSPNPEIRGLGEQAARAVLVRLAEAVCARLPPHVGRRQVFLRFYLTIGAPLYLTMGWERVLESARRRLGPDVRFEAELLAEEFVAFAAAGLRATSGKGGADTP
jgi:AcrR family transcriptional regulator